MFHIIIEINELIKLIEWIVLSFYFCEITNQTTNKASF